MNQLHQDVRAAILRALLAAKGPMPVNALKQHLRNVFAHVAFTDGDLNDHVITAEAANLIAGTSDEAVGEMWDLTARGKIKAQQLR